MTKDDPRVKAAWDWIGKNFTVDENPGLREGNPDQAKNGLYYYYLTMARALNAYDEPTVSNHDWRVALIDKLSSLQKEDGSFAGEKRWMEDNPVLITSYVAIALEETLADLKEHPAK